MINIETIKQLATLASEDSKKHGYTDAEKPVCRTLAKAAIEMAESVNAFRDKRFVPQHVYLTCKDNIKPEQKKWAQKRHFKKIYDDYAKDTVQDELADVAIYCLVALGNSKADFGHTKRAERPDLDKYISEVEYVDFSGFIMSMLTGPYIIPEVFDGCYSLTILSVIDHLDAYMEHHLDQSLEYWIREKMEYNQLRPYRHGRANDPTL